MTDTRDPRYMRTAGLTLLAILLVVASCQVEQASIIEVEQVTAEAVVEPVPTTVVDQEAGPADPTATEPEPEAVDAVRAAMEAARRAVEALLEQETAAIDDLPPPPTNDGAVDLSSNPVFTPMTVRPEIGNRAEVQAALMREYPTLLRDAGIGGTVVVWFYVTETGQVADRRISESSGHTPLDEAALNVANVFQFTPAMNRDEAVAVWIQLPITFQRN